MQSVLLNKVFVDQFHLTVALKLILNLFVVLLVGITASTRTEPGAFSRFRINSLSPNSASTQKTLNFNIEKQNQNRRKIVDFCAILRLTTSRASSLILPISCCVIEWLFCCLTSIQWKWSQLYHGFIGIISNHHGCHLYQSLWGTKKQPKSSIAYCYLSWPIWLVSWSLFRGVCCIAIKRNRQRQ